MSGRHGSEEKPGRRRSRGKGVWVAYVSTGAALAISRVSLFVWVNHVTASHQMTETLARLLWCLNPEAFVISHPRVAAMHLSGKLFASLWVSALTLGSFIIATPILLVGWLKQRRP